LIPRTLATGREKRQGGQIIILMMFLAIPMFLVLAFILNSATGAYKKTRLQNAADTSVMTEAAWVARSLNTMSMNNTAITQSVVVATTGYALEGPVHFAGWESGEIAGFYWGRITYFFSRGGPILGAIAAVAYLYVYDLLNKEVLKPLVELYRESKRAMHKSSDQGLARVAMGLGHMNRLIVQDGPGQITEFGLRLAEMNGASGTRTRYVGWAEKEQRHELAMPVVLQSFRKTKANAEKLLEQMKRNETDGDGAKVIASALQTTASIRNFLNIKFSGEYGTFKNFVPTCNPEFDYFGNFVDHGYKRLQHPKDTCFGGSRPVLDGPWVRTSEKADRAFTDTHNALKDFADGERVVRAVRKVIDDSLRAILACPRPFKIPFVGTVDPCKPIIDAVVRTIVRPFLKLAFDTGVKPTENDLRERMDSMWLWTAFYRETLYSHWPDIFPDHYDVPLAGKLYSPPWFEFGAAVGFLKGLRETALDKTFVEGEGGKTLNDLTRSSRVSEANLVRSKYQEKYETCKKGATNFKQGCEAGLTEGDLLGKEACQDDYKRMLASCEAEWWRGQAEAEDVLGDSSYTSSLTQYERIRGGLKDCPVRESVYKSEMNKELRSEFSDCLSEQTRWVEEWYRGLSLGKRQIPTAEQERFYREEKENAERYCKTDRDRNERIIRTQLESAKKMCVEVPKKPEAKSKTPTKIPKKFSNLRPPNEILWGYEIFYQLGMKVLPLPIGELKTDSEWKFFHSWDTHLYAIDSPRLAPDPAVDFLNIGVGAVLSQFAQSNSAGEVCDLSSARADWSIAHMLTEDVGIHFAPNGFPFSEKRFSAVSQAEVYNSQWFDLYTQNWRSKLTPFSLAYGCGHRKPLGALMTESPALKEVLIGDQLSDAQLEVLIAH
jgi:hypothetical protein